jgi:hypothetical protein
MTLIGFTGLRRSGKDTAAGFLADQQFVVRRFAGALKDMLSAYLEIRGVDSSKIFRMLEGDLKEAPSHYFEGRSPRHAMQTLGTEWGRQLIGDSIWVNTCLDEARRHDRVAIADVRFPNEAMAIRKAGGRIIKILRPGLSIDGHASESQIASIDADAVITNDGSLEQLQHAVIHAAKTLFVL